MVPPMLNIHHIFKIQHLVLYGSGRTHVPWDQQYYINPHCANVMQHTNAVITRALVAYQFTLTLVWVVHKIHLEHFPILNLVVIVNQDITIQVR